METQRTDQRLRSGLRPVLEDSGPAKRLIRYIAGRIEERRYISQHKRAIEAIEQRGELDALLEALDVTREQLAACTVPPLAARELLAGMIERIGVASEIPQSAMQLAELRCRSCDDWKLCRRWLSGDPSIEDKPTFCPNAELFQSGSLANDSALG